MTRFRVGDFVIPVRAQRQDGQSILIGGRASGRVGQRARVLIQHLMHGTYGGILYLQWPDHEAAWWYADACEPEGMSPFQRAVRDYIKKEIG